jgi:hypothetical protein
MGSLRAGSGAEDATTVTEPCDIITAADLELSRTHETLDHADRRLSERRQSVDKFSCPGCEHPVSVVVDGRWRNGRYRRMRACAKCHGHFGTTETPDGTFYPRKTEAA